MADGVYKFTAQIQLKILAILWRDELSYHVYKEVIKPKYFSKAIHIDLCRIIFDYHDKYGVSPTLDVLVEEVSKMCSKSKAKQKLEEDYLDCLDQMSRVELHDIDYVKDKLLTFGKRQALVDAILESADILEKQPEEKYGDIEKLIKDALIAGDSVGDLGIDFYKDVEERFLGYINNEDVIERIPTGMTKLDECLGGGLGRTEMAAVVAPPGRGKTTFLISVGGSALENGYNVLHISLENNEKQIMRNYDLRMLKKPMEVIEDNIGKAIQAIQNIKRYRRGKLKVKKYPTKSITVNTVRNLLDQLKAVEGFIPDVLIVDYGMLLKPTVSYNDKRSAIETVYEDLRSIADEYNLALWTAAQGNRGSLSKKVVTMTDLAECFAIGNICDVLVAICQTNKEKLKGAVRLFLAKIRDSADGLILSGNILYETKRLEFSDIVDQNADDDDEEEESENWEE